MLKVMEKMYCSIRKSDGKIAEDILLPDEIAQQVDVVNTSDIFAGRKMHNVVNEWLKTTTHPGECLNIYRLNS